MSLLIQPPFTQGFHPGYERKGVFSIEEVLGKLGQEDAVFDGDVVPVASLRYQTFAQSLECVSCGVRGAYFAKERSAKRAKFIQVITKENGKRKVTMVPPPAPFRATSVGWHFNLYAMNFNGTEILMTKDHILPKAKGGRDHIGNMQTMCKPCNGKKSDDLIYQPFLPFESILSV